MFNKILFIAKKELTGYFRSPIAYIVLIATISIFNIFFFMIIDQNQEATLQDIFKVMEFMFVFLVPILTMKLFAEEKASGTMEFLLTTPTSTTAIVIGKYLGSLTFLTTIIGLTSIYYFILVCFSQPEHLSALLGYFGIWLECAFFIAVGVMTSAFTRNQIVAAISAYMILFLLYFSLSFIQYASGTLEDVIRYISTLSHAENFVVGIFNSADVVYYLSGIIFCLVITKWTIDYATQ